jgi:hypothetical protein
MLWFIAAVGAVLCAMVAAHKNRSVVGWAVAGALFPLIAFIIVMCKEREPTSDEIWDEAERQRLSAVPR